MPMPAPPPPPFTVRMLPYMLGGVATLIALRLLWSLLGCALEVVNAIRGHLMRKYSSRHDLGVFDLSTPRRPRWSPRAAPPSLGSQAFSPSFSTRSLAEHEPLVRDLRLSAE